MIDKAHIAHTGVEATLNLARETIFWPDMSEQIKQKVQNCEVCMEFRDSQQNPPMQSHEIPHFPFQYISMDVFFAEYKEKKESSLSQLTTIQTSSN